jgi:hypothetical protein
MPGRSLLKALSRANIPVHDFGDMDFTTVSWLRTSGLVSPKSNLTGPKAPKFVPQAQLASVLGLVHTYEVVNQVVNNLNKHGVITRAGELPRHPPIMAPPKPWHSFFEAPSNL